MLLLLSSVVLADDEQARFFILAGRGSSANGSGTIVNYTYNITNNITNNISGGGGNSTQEIINTINNTGMFNFTHIHIAEHIHLEGGMNEVPSIRFQNDSNGFHLNASGVIDVNAENQFRVDLRGGSIIYDFQLGAFLPAPTGIVDFGSLGNKWKNGYFNGNVSAANFFGNIDASYIQNEPWITSYTDTNDTGLYYTKSEFDAQNTSYYGYFYDIFSANDAFTAVNARVDNLNLTLINLSGNDSNRVSAYSFTLQNSTYFSTFAKQTDMNNLSGNDSNRITAYSFTLQNTTTWSAINVRALLFANSTNVCTSTDKVTSVNSTNGLISINCAADVGGAGGGNSTAEMIAATEGKLSDSAGWINTTISLSTNYTNLFLGNSELDKTINFYEDGSISGEWFAWNNTLDYFYFSDQVVSANDLVSFGHIYASGDIYSNAAGGDLWLGTGTQTAAKFQGFANGTLRVLDFSVGTLTTADCDVKANTNGTLYCGTDATGAGGTSATGWVHSRVSSNVTTTFSNLTDMTVVLATGTWLMDCNIIDNSTIATTGHTYNMTFNTSTAQTYIALDSPVSATAHLGIQCVSTTYCQFADTGANAVTTPSMTFIHGLINTTTSTRITMSFRSEVLSSYASVLPGSSCTYTKIV